jgi:hypothetical protein
MFRAEELVRADLSPANYNAYLEKLKSKTSPLGEEDLADLAMEAITNEIRDLRELELGIVPHPMALDGCSGGAACTLN